MMTVNTGGGKKRDGRSNHTVKSGKGSGGGKDGKVGQVGRLCRRKKVGR